MWGAFQTGFALEMGARLQDAGHGDQPYALSVGSSSGSLVATAAAAGAPFDHGFARNAWIEFGRSTRLLNRNRTGLNPYPQALQGVLDRGLVDFERAVSSRTQVVLTAARVNPSQWRAFRSEGLSLLSHGLQLLLRGPCEKYSDYLMEGAYLLRESGRDLFEIQYFSNRPDLRLELHHGARVAGSAKEMRKALEASSRIPYLYGDPIRYGAEILIDGVFSNNAPVALALEMGVRDVFVVTSSRKGYVFDRPVQSLAARQAQGLLEWAARAADRIDGSRRGRKLAASLREIARLEDQIPAPAPLDLNALHESHPGQRVHVIHPEEPVSVNRFFESRPEVLGKLYDMGRAAAERSASLVKRAADSGFPPAPADGNHSRVA
jgi:predicted acylesterase/phospholipase RssA